MSGRTVAVRFVRPDRRRREPKTPPQRTKAEYARALTQARKKGRT